jgi:hypothetical protein
MPKVARTIGTTEDNVARAERELGRRLPPSFRRWILQNNGLGLGAVHVYPVLDDRDPRKTWDSIVRNFKVGWEAWLEIFAPEREAFAGLLPFADFGTGDYYCFDYSQLGDRGEPVVVLWSHETGECEARGESFEEFARRLQAGEFED